MWVSVVPIILLILRFVFFNKIKITFKISKSENYKTTFVSFSIFKDQ